MDDGPPPIPILQPRSLERGVYEFLCEQIVNGRLLPGDPLVEGRFSAEFGVSKTPVREALIRLQRDGLVEIVPYRGARVASLSTDDVRSVCELRRWIEVPIARRAAERRPKELLEQLSQNIEAAVHTLATQDRDAYVATVRAFSDILMAHAENPHATEILIRLRNKLALIANASRVVPGRAERSLEDHRGIWRAISAGDLDAAEQATLAHIESIERDCLASLAGTLLMEERTEA